MKITLLMLTSLSSASIAASIGISFGGDGGGGDTSFAPSDTAGVITQANWNASTAISSSINGAVDSSGASTGVNVSWTSDESWSDGPAGPTTDSKLVSGWLSMNTTSTVGTVNLSGISYATYDLYLYSAHDRVNLNTTFGESNGAFSDVSITEIEDDTTRAANPFIYVNGTNGSGNYVLIQGLTANALDLTFRNDADNRAGFAGIQVVEVPEPSSSALLGLGSLALIMRRKKHP